MSFWQLFYHIVWSTKNREPLLTPQIEPMVYGFLRSKAIGLGGTVFALGGTETHVHLVAAIPPSIAVATFIGQVKGVTATRLNKSGCGATLYWQEEYAVFSFGSKNLQYVVAYVENQKQHHAQNQVIPALERTGNGGVALVREDGPVYVTQGPNWWAEFVAYVDCPATPPDNGRAQ